MYKKSNDIAKILLKRISGGHFEFWNVWWTQPFLYWDSRLRRRTISDHFFAMSFSWLMWNEGICSSALSVLATRCIITGCASTESLCINVFYTTVYIGTFQYAMHILNIALLNCFTPFQSSYAIPEQQFTPLQLKKKPAYGSVVSHFRSSSLSIAQTMFQVSS